MKFSQQQLTDAIDTVPTGIPFSEVHLMALAFFDTYRAQVLNEYGLAHEAARVPPQEVDDIEHELYDAALVAATAYAQQRLAGVVRDVARLRVAVRHPKARTDGHNRSTAPWRTDPALSAGLTDTRLRARIDVLYSGDNVDDTCDIDAMLWRTTLRIDDQALCARVHACQKRVWAARVAFARYDAFRRISRENALTDFELLLRGHVTAAYLAGKLVDGAAVHGTVKDFVAQVAARCEAGAAAATAAVEGAALV